MKRWWLLILYAASVAAFIVIFGMEGPLSTYVLTGAAITFGAVAYFLARGQRPEKPE